MNTERKFIDWRTVAQKIAQIKKPLTGIWNEVENYSNWSKLNWVNLPATPGLDR